MTETEARAVECLRTNVLVSVMVSAFVFLGVILWRTQVAHGERYREDLRRQTIRRARLPGHRGRIYDRTGYRCLAEDRPSYCVAVYLEEHRQPGPWSNTVSRVMAAVDRVAVLLGRPPDITTADVWVHIRKRLPLPLLAWHELTDVELARFSEHLVDIQGMGTQVEPVRSYPYGDLASHLIGYVGRAEPPAAEEEPFAYYLPEAEGKRGVEQLMNERLAGKPGARLIRVSASGTKSSEEDARLPVSGADVMLSIDVRIQSLAEQSLEGEIGAAVVLDVRTGDVLAMASSPRFDPNTLRRDWAMLRADPRRPLVNRAAVGRYPPGSPFKLIVAVAALENERASPATTFACPGFLQVGRHTRLSCWREAGHGPLMLQRAIEQSCNVYFAELGCLCGYPAIYHTATAMGLGHRTGADLDSESRGHLAPGGRGHRLGRGDLCNVCIGQGETCVTPLQMAVVTAAVASGGTVFRPRIVRGTRRRGETEFALLPIQSRNLGWSQTTVDTVRNGMRDVVQAPHGTGRRAAVPGLTMGGKTGTAEYGPKEEGRKHGWMVAFAPFESPRYAVAIVIEDAIAGGVTVGPRLKRLMTQLFGL